MQVIFVFLGPPTPLSELYINDSKGETDWDFITKNHNGDLCLEGCKALQNYCSIFHAEAFGLREARNEASILGIINLLVVGDNSLFYSIHRLSTYIWEIDNIIWQA